MSSSLLGKFVEQYGFARACARGFDFGRVVPVVKLRHWAHAFRLRRNQPKFYYRVIFVLAFVALAVGVLTPRGAGAARLFTSGFETDNFTETEWTSGGGAIQSAIVHAGTYANDVNLGSGQSAVFTRFLSPAPTSGTVSTRFYVYFPSPVPTQANRINDMRSDGGALSWTVRQNADMTLRLLNSITGTGTSTSAVLAADSWYRIEVRHLLDDVTGELELRLYQGDSTTLLDTVSITGEDTLLTDSREHRFGRITTAASAFRAIFDDIAINDDSGSFQNSWAGAGKVVLVEPTFDDSVGWNANPSGSNAANVNDEPGLPDGDTTYNSVSDTTSEDRFFMSELPDDVPVGATLTLAHVFARAGGDGTSARSIRLRWWNEEGTAITGPQFNTNVNGYRKGGIDELLVVDLSTSTRVDVSRSEIGYVANSGSSLLKKVTALWANVEWSVEAAGGAGVSSRSVAMSDSRPSVGSNHTIQFTVNTAIDESETVEVTWPAGFLFPTNSDWYNLNWQYRKKITIDSTKITGTSDLLNFPVLIDRTDTDWRHTDNGGNVGSATGWDFVFTAADGTTQLDHEIERYATTTGELVAWVRIPTLSRSAANELFVYYGYAAAGDQQNVTGVWDSSYAMVHHLEETGTCPVTFSDSTSNGNDGSCGDAPTASSTGQINGAWDFDGTNDYVSISSFDPPHQGTVSLWFKWEDADGSVRRLLGGHDAYEITLNTSFTGLQNNLFAGGADVTVGSAITDESWHYVAMTYDFSSNKHRNYLDGALDTSSDKANDDPGGPFELQIASRQGINFFNGLIEEVRISSSTRSSTWIQTEYNNQSSPSTFYSVGIEEDRWGLTCDDVDVATGTEFTLSTRAQGCEATATQWGVTFVSSSRTFILTAPTSTQVYVATGTQVTIEIGTNATSQVQGNSQIINPSTGGTYTIFVSGTFGGAGDMLVSIQAGLLVEVAVREHLSIAIYGVPNWYDANWGFRKRIIVDSTSVSGTQGHVDFPMLFNSTRPDFRHTDNGGNVGSATGWDFVFTAADGTTKLDHEIEKYASTTGELVAWARVPFLSTTSTNELFVYYGYAAASDQQNITEVWDASYAGVWHLTTTSTNTTLTLDSTVNSNTGTKLTATEPSTTSTGQINGAQDFDGDDDYILTAAMSIGNTNFTVSGWVNGSVDENIDIVGQSNGSGERWNVRRGSDNTFSFYTDATGWIGGNTVVAGWASFAIVKDDSGTNIYTNGLFGNDGPGGYDVSSNNIGVNIGRFPGLTFFNGTIDEIRISTSVRASAWILTEYNNQNSPETFYTLGAEEAQAQTSCTADDGASVTVVNTTGVSVPFGTVAANTFYIGCQDIEASTNAGGGYSITVHEERPMRTAGGDTIPDTTCDAGGCTESAAAAWTSASNNGFGHTCRNQVNNDCAAAYNDGIRFRQFADFSSGETAQTFMVSSTPVRIATGRIKLRLSRGAAQAAGTYTTIIVYTIMATY